MARSQRWIAADQFVNTFISSGWADETISGRCYRMGVVHSDPVWAAWRVRIDRWAARWPWYQVDHCRQAYLNDKAHLRSPFDERK